MRIGSLRFYRINTNGNCLNHAVVNVITRTDIDEIKVGPVLQGLEGDGKEVINLKIYETGPTDCVHATFSESVFEGDYKCLENVGTFGTL